MREEKAISQVLYFLVNDTTPTISKRLVQWIVIGIRIMWNRYSPKYQHSSSIAKNGDPDAVEKPPFREAMMPSALYPLPSVPIPLHVGLYLMYV